ncbi:MAG TPA: TolC family protein [Candidatus Binatia bacterium]|nr:TolC family protein [Candidatus Binatia bacterium]
MRSETLFDHNPGPRARAYRAVGIFLALHLGVPAVASLAISLAAPVAASAQTWTLDRVLETARRSDPGIAAARAAGDAGSAAAASGWSALSPRIGLDAGWTRSDDPALLFSQKLWQGRFTAADFALPTLNDPAPRSAWNWGATAEQPLWNGGAEVTAPALAAHRGRAARESARAAVADRLLEVAGVYVEAVRARDALEADSIALAAAEESRRSAVERFRRGQIPELDTLRATAHWAETRVAALGSDRRVQVALARLATTVGQRVLREDLGMLPDPAGQNRDASRSEPYVAARPEYVAAREEARARGIEVTRASLALLPSLNARADVRRYEDPESGGGARRFFVGLTASFPIWDGTRRIQERRIARARADEAVARAELLKRALAASTLDAAVDAEVSLDRRDAAHLGAASAEEALRLAQGRYRAGLLPQSDLLAVEAEAARARHARVDAESDAVLAQYRLLHARGMLE